MDYVSVLKILAGFVNLYKIFKIILYPFFETTRKEGKTMSKLRNVFRKLVLMACLCSFLSGCSPLKNEMNQYSYDKEQCDLVSENVTQFTYKDEIYTILEHTVSNGELGEWLGYIRQLAAVSEDGEILLQENIEDASFGALSDLAGKAPDAKYIIPFLNVYALPESDAHLIVDVSGGYHEAVPASQLTEKDTVFDFRAAAESDSSFKVNPQNATQLLWGEQIYQVTEETVPTDQLSNYLDILNATVIFDINSKHPLSKEELDATDWTGSSSSQQRERWFYMDVYEISGTDREEAVAVKVNNQYHIARLQ